VTPEGIREKDKGVHAFLEVFDDFGKGDKQTAIKDNIMYEGHRSTAASRILENFVSPYDATVVKKLKAAGFEIIGRTNMDEFAMGSSTENSAYGTTRNPYDPNRVAGGSSGGSAAAVASGMVRFALGSDTGGSIRQPAAFCGVVGLKPTYGRVSRFGLISMASSLDQIGPFAKTVADVETIYDIIKGQDTMDSTTISDGTYPIKKKFSKTIGIPRKFVESEGVSKEVKKNFEESVEKFKSLDYKIEDIELPHIKYSLATYYIIMPAEVSSNLARFDGVKYGTHVSGKDGIDDYFKTRGANFGKEVRRRIILGTFVLSSGYYDEYYGKALEMKKLITREIRGTFKEVDLIMTPTTPSPAWKMGEKSNDPLEMYLEDIFTVHANISGCPAISLPSGFAGNLPLGIELTADLGREDNLFVAGKEFLGE
jgi:aspartyl-tRNA(Asn)/glutamyl-tRNA(Gln) amidotransferase subunit A